ncbi:MULTISPECIES: hypothetical protein [Cupriavidus]|uniref:hypothetical protein n=1 Tax=Cupriavidus TaxID=106589 RepID=UPI0002A4306E|nr:MULTISPECIES: hypothetical protein [Cupriavidus]EKZ98611.1 hypothetical protein D769_14358 [Cupriavidus sp. HMR-1]
MYSRLPTTYELIEALQASPQAGPAAESRLATVLWAGFVLALVPMLVAGGALVWWHRVLAQVPPAWLPQAFHVLLAVCGVFYVGAWVIRLLDRRAALQHPLRWLTRRLDTQSEVENALLLRLGRIPALQLRARQRRVVLQARLWDASARTMALVLAIGPAAVILADGVAVMAPGRVPALVAIYGAVLVAGCALALFAQLQCSAPLRRLAHVLGEAAEINEAVNRQRQP